MEKKELLVNAEEKLNRILDFVEKSVVDTGNFVVEQTPLLIQELLAWGFTISLIWFLIGIFALLLNILIWVIANKIYKKCNDDVIFIPAIFVSLGLMAFAFCQITENTDWIKIKVAPRVWLVEYTKDFIKK